MPERQLAKMFNALYNFLCSITTIYISVTKMSVIIFSCHNICDAALQINHKVWHVHDKSGTFFLFYTHDINILPWIWIFNLYEQLIINLNSVGENSPRFKRYASWMFEDKFHQINKLT